LIVIAYNSIFDFGLWICSVGVSEMGHGESERGLKEMEGRRMEGGVPMDGEWWKRGSSRFDKAQ